MTRPETPTEGRAEATRGLGVARGLAARSRLGLRLGQGGEDAGVRQVDPAHSAQAPRVVDRPVAAHAARTEHVVHGSSIVG